MTRIAGRAAMVNWRSAALATAFVVLTVDVKQNGVLTAFERRHTAHPPPAHAILRWVTKLGDPHAAGPLMVLAALAPRGGDREPPRQSVVRCVVTLAGRALIARIVRRPRPPELWWQESPSGFSFPSRHTTWAAVAAYELVRSLPGHCRPRAHVGAFATVATVGVSRVRLGVHWPTDVIAAVLWTAGCRAGTSWVLSCFPTTRRSA